MHTLYYIYLDFENKHNLKIIELWFLPNNQYMRPDIFKHVITKKNDAPKVIIVKA
jgi:hypothetical protein